jgi:vacuolar-type H+-ATPase catalytic subunit A/Vma1
VETSIWLKNLEGKIIELDNTTKSKLCLAKEKNHTLLNCRENDLILCSTPTHMFQNKYEVIYRSDNKTVTEAIIFEINRILREKSQLLRERQILKKMKQGSISHLIDDINKQLRNQFFEFDIKDILRKINEN